MAARRSVQLSCAPPQRDQPRVRANPALLAAGWERRYLADPGRAEEARATYVELGFEVLLEPPAPDQFDNSCAACAETACDTYVLIYTRRPRD